MSRTATDNLHQHLDSMIERWAVDVYIAGLGIAEMDVDGLYVADIQLAFRKQGIALAVVVDTGADTCAYMSAGQAVSTAVGTGAGTVVFADISAEIVALAAATLGTSRDTAPFSADLAIQMRALLRRPPKGPGEPRSHCRCQHMNEHRCRASSCAWMTGDA